MIQMFREKVLLAERQRPEAGPVRPQIARVRLFRQNLPLRNRLDEDRSFRDFRDRFPLEMAAVVFPREFFCPHGAVIGADQDFSEAFLPEDSFPRQIADRRGRCGEIRLKEICLEVCLAFSDRGCLRSAPLKVPDAAGGKFPHKIIFSPVFLHRNFLRRDIAADQMRALELIEVAD